MKFAALLVILFLASAPSILGAQEVEVPDRALASQQRRVAVYGFEEAAEFHTLLPAPFFRVLTRDTGRPGLPHFGGVEVDDSVAWGGSWSLRFDVAGASIVVALPTAELPIFPQSRYQIRARVRTEGLANAGASIAVRLHDIDGTEIPGTRRTGVPVRTHGEWTTLSVEPPMDIAEATDMVLELRVDQPSFNPVALGEQDVRLQKKDISGSAWFDEIEVWQLPRMIFNAIPASGSTRLPERPSLEALLRDLTMGTVSAVLRVRDIEGLVRQERMLELKRGKSHLTMDLEPMPPGWYLGELEVFDDDEVVAHAQHGLVILPEGERLRMSYGAPYFGIAADTRRMFHDESDLLLLRMLRPDYAVIPVWEAGESGAFTADNAHRVDMILDALHMTRIEPVFELAGVPSDVQDSQHLDADQVLALLSSHEHSWGDLLKPWMAHYGDEVSRWRIRSELDLGFTNANTGSLLGVARFADEFVAAPSIELASSLQPESGAVPSLPDGATAFVLEIPNSVDPEEVGKLVRATSKADMVVHLASSSAENSVRIRAEQTARRMVEAWAAGATLIEIPAPWRTARGERGVVPGLDSAGVAFRRVASFLSGRRPEVEVPLGRGVRAFLVGGRGEPMLVAWATDRTSVIELGLGDRDLVVHDIFGGKRHIEGTAVGQTLALDATPVMIEGIDMDTARFRAGAKIEPAKIEAAIGLHEIDVHLVNPWDEAIDVRVKPIGPTSFRFQPRSRIVTIQANEQAMVPFEFSYPRTQVDGSIELRIDTDIRGANPNEIVLVLPSIIQSTKIEVDTEWRQVNDDFGHPTGILVTVRAHNIGSTPLRLEAFTSASGYAPMRKTMPEIPPGGSAGRTFAFPGGAEKLAGYSLLVGVSEFEGSGRVVRRVPIPVELGSLVGVDPLADE